MRLTSGARCRAPLIFVDKNQHKTFKVQSTEMLMLKRILTTTDFF